jgi:osmotically-inducible protein OsmY
MVVSDELIKRDIVDQLYWDSSVDASKVKVAVSEGQVQLTGWVKYMRSRRAAESDASMIPEVVSVDNQIAIEPLPTERAVTDGELHNRIQQILSWTSDINYEDIKVYVETGWVILEGSVNIYWKKMMVEHFVSNLSGVLGVTNGIAIVPTEKITDKKIAKDIMSALERTLDENMIDVKVEDGKVTLSGTIFNDGARRTAEDIAKHSAGVTEVISKLNMIR